MPIPISHISILSISAGTNADPAGSSVRRLHLRNAEDRMDLPEGSVLTVRRRKANDS